MRIAYNGYNCIGKLNYLSGTAAAFQSDAFSFAYSYKDQRMYQKKENHSILEELRS